MHIRFWGSRGSIASSGPETLRYGGNTLSVEARVGPEQALLIFDAGTGLRKLGQALLAEGKPVRAHIFLGHTHADHIQGLPFFGPLFLPTTHLTVYGPAGVDRSFADAVRGQMEYSYFPVPFSDLSSRVDFVELDEGSFVLEGHPEIEVRTQHLNHTSPCLGYRVERGGVSVVYATDHEPHAEALWRPTRQPDSFDPGDILHPGDARHCEFLHRADLVIHDAQYTAQEYANGKRTWGHSSVEYAIDVSLAARVRRLALIHHDPTRDDDAIDALGIEARARVMASRKNLDVFPVAEGQVLTLQEKREPTSGTRWTIPVPRPVTGARILLAEDDESIARLLEESLSSDGYEVVWVRNGEQAVHAATVGANGAPFQLIMLDFDMPVMDARKACRALRLDPRIGADVPIVVLTAQIDDLAVAAAFEDGATDYMTKPFAVSQVRARVRSWLARASGVEETGSLAPGG